MFAYTVYMPMCGSCGVPLLQVDKQPYNPVKKKGIVQVICAHRECSDYDKPMEFDLPKVELRPTNDAHILEQVEKPRLLVTTH